MLDQDYATCEIDQVDGGISVEIIPQDQPYSNNAFKPSTQKQQPVKAFDMS
jgi:hypothetical protein